MIVLATLLSCAINIKDVFAVGQWVDRTALQDKLGGLELSFAIRDPDADISGWDVSQFPYKGTSYLVFSKNHGDNIIEPLSVQALPSEVHLGYRRCSINGVNDPELIGAFLPTKDHIMRSPLEAYRANRQTLRLESISTEGLTCINPLPYH